MAFPRSKGRSLALQQLRLLKLFPDARSRIQRSELTFETEITPTPTSDTYRIRLTYKLGDKPRVVVLSPELGPIDGCPLPHTYDGKRLCLYWRGEWNRDEFLLDTVVPWASEWLANYETWAFTGKWLGGGTHPEQWDRPTPAPSAAPVARAALGLRA
jgi:hypothetical protein